MRDFRRWCLLVALASAPASAAAAADAPFEIETLDILATLAEPSVRTDEPAVHTIERNFDWTFSEPPVLLLNAFVEGADPVRPVLAAPIRVTRQGYKLAYYPVAPLRPGETLKVRTHAIAVVPQEDRSVAGGSLVAKDGAVVALPDRFFARSGEAGPRFVGVTARTDAGQPLYAAAVYRSRQRSFKVRIYDVNRQPYAGAAQVQWLAARPRAGNPFFGDETNLGMHRWLGRFPTKSRPMVVTNAWNWRNEQPWWSAWSRDIRRPRPGDVPARKRNRYWDLFFHRASVAPEPGGASNMELHYLMVESFHNTSLSRQCRVEVLARSPSPPLPLAAFAASTKTGLSGLLAREVDGGVGGASVLVRVHGPPGTSSCTGDLSFELAATGIIERYSTVQGPGSLAVGLYRAELRGGVVEEGEPIAEGLQTVVWHAAAEDWQGLLKNEIGMIVVTQAADRLRAGKVINAALEDLSNASDASTCDHQVNRRWRVTLGPTRLLVRETYRVFGVAEASVKQGSAGLAEGYTAVLFAPVHNVLCEKGSNVYGSRKRLAIRNVSFRGHPGIRKGDAISAGPAPVRPPGARPSPTSNASTAPPATPGPPGSLRIRAHNDVPGPVKLRVTAHAAGGARVFDQTIAWAEANNAYTTKTLRVPLGARRVRIRFLNDLWTRGGPDQDRNAQIDWVELHGARVEGEAFASTGGKGRHKCGKRKAQAQSGGFVAICGNSNDWVEYEFAVR